MARGKLILICQFGGNFVTIDDGTLSYNGGEAEAVYIDSNSLFDDLKLKLAEKCNFEYNSVSLKYFLPMNRKVLITLKNDKDLKRMMDYHMNSKTTDIFITGNSGFNRDGLISIGLRGSEIKLAEKVIPIASPIPINSMGPNDTSPKPRGGPTEIHDPSNTKSSSQATATATTTSTPTEHGGATGGASEDSDYSPRARSSSALDSGGTPADTVKKRRRTASWKVGKNGPTIVALADETKPLKKRDPLESTDQDLVNVPWADSLETPSGYAMSYEEWPEKVIESWKIGILGVGQEFKSVKEFREALQKYAIAHRFVYKLKKNDTVRASGRCVQENCSWRIHASFVPSSRSFKIKKFNNLHTCPPGNTVKTSHPSKNWLLSIIKDKLQDLPNQKPKDIANDILREYGVKLSYTQIWRAMEDAKEQLQGTTEESYNQLPLFCSNFIEKNPGSLANLITHEDKKFKSLFISLHPAIQGFKNGSRPLIFLESTPLKSKYFETLLLAISIDANDGFFPIALSIVDVENNENWRGFISQLKSSLSDPRSDKITFVSDKEKGLKNIILEFFENSNYGYSIYHLIESFKKNSKGPFQGDRGLLPSNLLFATHSLRLSAFKKFTEQIKQISSSAYDWVIQIEPEYYTSLFFRGEHYNYITENVAESYVNLMESTRDSTVIRKLEGLLNLITETMKNRKNEGTNWLMKLTPIKESKIEEEMFKAKGLKVLCSSDVLFEVHDEFNHVVNIENRECTCLEWKESGIPCRHAIAVFNFKGKSVYEFCSKYFTSEAFRLTYSEVMTPVNGNFDEKEKNGEVAVLPPTPPEMTPEQMKLQAAKKDIWNSRTVTCTRCKEPGHNKSTCKAVLL